MESVSKYFNEMIDNLHFFLFCCYDNMECHREDDNNEDVEKDHLIYKNVDESNSDDINSKFSEDCNDSNNIVDDDDIIDGLIFSIQTCEFNESDNNSENSYSIEIKINNNFIDNELDNELDNDNINSIDNMSIDNDDMSLDNENKDDEKIQEDNFIEINSDDSFGSN